MIDESDGVSGIHFIGPSIVNDTCRFVCTYE